MRLALFGLNHKSASIDVRDRFAAVMHRLFKNSLEERPFSSVLLSTCNRTEIYLYLSEDKKEWSLLQEMIKQELPASIWMDKTYFATGIEAFKHLCRVISGLDSALLAETEIQGQVKMAYRMACEHQTLPRQLHYLFQKGLKIGKTMRCLYLPSSKSLSLEGSLSRLMESHLIEDTSKILFVGASLINEKLIHHFTQKQAHELFLVNRNISERSKRIKEHSNIPLLSWQELSNWSQYEVVVVATKSPHFLEAFNRADQEIQTKVIFDLSVPRNVNPNIENQFGIKLYNIDEINSIDPPIYLEANETYLNCLFKLDELCDRQLKLFEVQESLRSHHTKPALSLSG